MQAGSLGILSELIYSLFCGYIIYTASKRTQPSIGRAGPARAHSRTRRPWKGALHKDVGFYGLLLLALLLSLFLLLLLDAIDIATSFSADENIEEYIYIYI